MQHVVYQTALSAPESKSLKRAQRCQQTLTAAEWASGVHALGKTSTLDMKRARDDGAAAAAAKTKKKRRKKKKKEFLSAREKKIQKLKNRPLHWQGLK